MKAKGIAYLGNDLTGVAARSIHVQDELREAQVTVLIMTSQNGTCKQRLSGIGDFPGSRTRYPLSDLVDPDMQRLGCGIHDGQFVGATATTART